MSVCPPSSRVTSTRVRVSTALPARDVESAYRLLIEELPDESQHAPAAGVLVRTRVEIPVFHHAGRGGAHGGERGGVERVVGQAQGVDRGVLRHPIAGVGAEPGAQGRIVEEGLERSAESGTIVDLDQQTGIAMMDDLGIAADLGGDDRQTSRAGFEQGDRQTFGLGRKREHIERRKNVGHIVARAQQMDTIGDLQALCLCGQISAQRAIAGQHYLQLRMSGREGRHLFEQQAMIFQTDQTADATDDRSVGRDAERGA